MSDKAPPNSVMDSTESEEVVKEFEILYINESFNVEYPLIHL